VLIYIAGKGITDQNRNILTNQMLILGFLRSAAPFLAVGPLQSFTPTHKRKQIDDDDTMENGEDEVDEGNPDQLQNNNTSRRGTVLLTLRNVVPYTQW
jgi:25S rRNA (uracil2634-N3)-methyltransferase